MLNLSDENRNYGRNFDVIKKTCELLTHEEMHMLLNNINVDTSRKYDNIKDRLRLSGYMA